jgi:hypothetical protein
MMSDAGFQAKHFDACASRLPPLKHSDDEPDVSEATERAGEEQVGDGARRVLWNFRYQRRDVGEQLLAATRHDRMHRHHGLAPVELFEHGGECRALSHPARRGSLAAPCQLVKPLNLLNPSLRVRQVVSSKNG